jgi:hypothetical protein
MKRLPEFSKLKDIMPVNVETTDTVTGYYLSANEKKIKKRKVLKNAGFNLSFFTDDSFKKNSEWLKDKTLINSDLIATTEIRNGKKVNLPTFFIYDELKVNAIAQRMGKIAMIKEEKQVSDYFYNIPKKFLYVTGGFLLMVLGYKLYNKNK